MDELRVVITDGDVRMARRAWVAARDGGGSPARVQLAFDDLCHVMSTQAQQIAEDFRAATRRPCRTDITTRPLTD